MIRALRARHRRLWTALLFLLPGFAVLALLARGDLPPRAPIPAALTARPPALGPDAVAVPGFESLGAAARWSAREGGGGVFELRAARPLPAPDLLLYASSLAPGDALPADAALVGGYPGRGPRTYALGPEARSVFLYSLGHGAVAASAALPVSPAGGGT